MFAAYCHRKPPLNLYSSLSQLVPQVIHNPCPPKSVSSEGDSSFVFVLCFQVDICAGSTSVLR